MEITVDIESATPMFSQLVMQIKQAVQNGQITPGDPLPSIRQLANDLEMNNKTVAKAYRLLERDSVIQAKGYRGTFIHPEALANCTIDLSPGFKVSPPHTHLRNYAFVILSSLLTHALSRT